MPTQITWENFEIYNHDARGIRYKFEDLCRQIFVNENLSNNSKFRYPHANPNNPGLECEPIYDEKNKRWIGFQAKYFDDRVVYDQILKSAQQIIDNYQEAVDHVFLFCNKQIDASSKAPNFQKTVSLLSSAHIELELITGDTILDLVRKYPYLGLYYFGNHELSHEWFLKHDKLMFKNLGERFNVKFNVDTEASHYLSLFVQDENALRYINGKKQHLINRIDSLYWQYETNRPYLIALKEAVSALGDVSFDSISDCLSWKKTLCGAVKDYLEEIKVSKDELQKQCDDIQTQIKASTAGANGTNGDDGTNKTISKTVLYSLENRYHELRSRINELDTLSSLPNEITLNDFEVRLIENRAVFVRGTAGCGKSHLLANETKQLLTEHRDVLLLLGGVYLSNDPIKKQIVENLNGLGDISEFSQLIEILEIIGERTGKIVPVFVDALNETWVKDIWKTGISSIIDTVLSQKFVKIVFTYRDEYQTALLPESLVDSIKTGESLAFYHCGFAKNDIESIREFLNYYNVPFTPTEYFYGEFTTPLFLTLYCKTYNGDDVDLPTLYERLIYVTNRSIVNNLGLKARGYSEDDNILESFVNEVSNYLIEHDARIITKKDLCQLKFWSDYGIAPQSFIRQLSRENFLYDFMSYENEEYYTFSYDQMNDYYCAKAIMAKAEDKSGVRKYLTEKILNICDGDIQNYADRDLFIDTCALYAKKYHEECINIIDQINDDNVKADLFSRYIESFEWRNDCTVAVTDLFDMVAKYPMTVASVNKLWAMFIGNSVKNNSCFNADGLHSYLLKKKLNIRDYLWTVFINGLTDDESNRLVQLIELYEKGDKLEFGNKKQVELLLTLLGWVLTSSNRWLRDNASKAMIEILKDHFELAIVLLDKFKNCNDPYVVQRIYGIIFGACTKCNSIEKENGVYQQLAEYVYSTVFNKEKIYPDILLRDYARQIIELFLIENPEYQGAIDSERIRPPYNSDPIPSIADQHYIDQMKNLDGGMLRLLFSMSFDGEGHLYGDFGRYIFQSALHDFDVDHYKIFNYAVYFIINELGYNNELFSQYDMNCNNSNRHKTIKTERIGKKYQWIAMYNILARITDHCKMDGAWFQDSTVMKYEGPWEPYVRDFDPTLNSRFMYLDGAPYFEQLDEFIKGSRSENDDKYLELYGSKDKNGGERDTGRCKNKKDNLVNEDLDEYRKPDVQEEAWLREEGSFYTNLFNNIILTGEDNSRWISLSRYYDTGREDLVNKKLYVWCNLYCYFVNVEQVNLLRNCFEKGLSITTSEICSPNQVYSIFNREYPWAASCKTVIGECSSVDVNIKTGEYEKQVQHYSEPDIAAYEKVLIKLGYISGEITEEDEDSDILDIEYDSDGVPEVPYTEITREVEIEKKVGEILHADLGLLWEEEYDASKEKALGWEVPCAKLINDLKLSQLEADDFYFDTEGNLAAFDTELNNNYRGVVVRKDLMDKFLKENNLQLIWIVDSDKEIHSSGGTISHWSDWQGLYSYDGFHVTGGMRLGKVQ